MTALTTVRSTEMVPTTTTAAAIQPGPGIDSLAASHEIAHQGTALSELSGPKISRPVGPNEAHDAKMPFPTIDSALNDI